MPQKVPDHVVFYTAPARLTREDIRSIVHLIDAKLALHEKIGIVSDVTGLESMTPGAMPVARRVIRETNVREITRVCARVLTLGTVEEIEQLLLATFGRPHGERSEVKS